MLISLVHYPKNQQTHGSLWAFYAKIVAMDKIIKTISESGAFRAFVLDSTETVRHCSRKHQTQASSTVALGRTLYCQPDSRSQRKGNTNLQLRCWTQPLGAILIVDTKGNVKDTFKILGVDIKKTATGEVLVGPLSEMVNLSLSQTTVLETLTLYDSSHLWRNR